MWLLPILAIVNKYRGMINIGMHISFRVSDFVASGKFSEVELLGCIVILILAS